LGRFQWLISAPTGSLRTDAGIVQFETVEHGGGEPRLFSGGEVFGVGFLNRTFLHSQLFGHRFEDRVFLFGRKLRQFARGGYGFFAHQNHFIVQVHFNFLLSTNFH